MNRHLLFLTPVTPAHFLKIAILGLWFFLADQNAALAVNNPLAAIPADSLAAQSGGIKIEAGSEGGSDLCSIQNGDCAVYKSYDFDSGVAAFQARVASLNHGLIEIRLDRPTGPLMGQCPFQKTRTWDDWENITCPVNNSLAGVRDIYLIFKGTTGDDGANGLVKVSSFVFLKSVVTDPAQVILGSPARVDDNDDEPQAAGAWGIPETGFTDNFEDGALRNWKAFGIICTNAGDRSYAAESCGTNFDFAFTPGVYINKTDTGGDWRTLAEASLAADLTIDSPAARPGIGFASKNGGQWIYAALNATGNSIEVWRQLATGEPAKMKEYSLTTNTVPAATLRTGRKYRLQMDWSPYSDGLIVFLHDEDGTALANFRLALDLPAARRPLLACSGGPARFNNVRFDPTLDGWNFKWQWKKTPALAHDVCNPAVWKWRDGKYYMMWRKFGMDTYHGIAASTDGIHWQRVNDEILKCRGDMNVLVDPFGDGLVYVTPGGDNMPWWTSDGSQDFTVWKDSGRKLGNIFGNSRIQEIIDTKKYPQMTPIRFASADYRFIGFTENWTDLPQPHTVVLLSNTLTNWVLADPNPLIPPRADFWGEKGSAIGSAFVLPDGNILVASCSCTFAGYTGAPEPSNVSAIVDGKQPWKVLKLGTLPDAPVSRENVWYEGPNFGTAYYYDPGSDTLFFYGGFHDYNIGVMRVQHFSRSSLITQNLDEPKAGLMQDGKASVSGRL